MHSIDNSQLHDIFEKLTSSKLRTDNRPVTICFICYSLLQRCLKLREISKTSEEIFAQFFGCGFELTEDTISILHKRNVQKLLVTPVKTLTFGILKNDTDSEEIPLCHNQSISSNINPGKLQELLRTPVKNIDISMGDSAYVEEKADIQYKSQIQRKLQKLLVTPVEIICIGFNSDDTKIKEENVYISHEDSEESDNGLFSDYEKNIKPIANPLDSAMTSPDPHNGTYQNSSDGDESDSHVISEFKSEIIEPLVCIKSGDMETLAFITDLKNNNKDDKTELEHTLSSEKKIVKKSEHGITLKFILNNYKSNRNTPRTDMNNTKRETSNEKLSKSTRKDCNESSRFKHSLDKHTSIHGKGKPLACKLCTKTFHLENRLKLHEKIHSEDKQITCPQCNKSFCRLSYLNRHLRIHSEVNQLVCKFCHKGFKTTSNLTQHVRTHTGEKPFACDECNKRFRQLSNLMQHKRVHSGDKPYSCHICGQNFAQKSNLLQHSRVHTGIRPFGCHMCNKTFTQKSNLVQHMKLNHDS